MSMGGCYASIHQTVLEDILENKKSLQEYINSLQDDEKYSVEQAWDGIRVMLRKDIPNILGETILEDVDLGEQAMLISILEKETIVEQFETITTEKLYEIQNSVWFKNESFYWDNVYKNDTNSEHVDHTELVAEVLKLKEFFNQEVKKINHVLVFWVS